MKRFLYFVKRRFCPVMLALLVMFFSAVIPVSRVEASPAPVLPPNFEVIPGGLPPSPTYFDVFSSLYIPSGVDVKMADGKSFDQQLWEEICDTFELWVEVNDFKELGTELRGLIADAVDGTINVSKKLFEAVQQYGKEAADYVKSHTVDKSQLIDGKYISFDYIDSLTGGSYSNYMKTTYNYSESKLLSFKNDFDSKKYEHFILFRDKYKISGIEHDVYRFCYDYYNLFPYFYFESSNGSYGIVLTDASGTYGGSCYYTLFPVKGSPFLRDNWSYYNVTPSTPIVATNMTQVVKPASPGDPVSPVQPPYPVSHIIFTPRPDPVTWPDYVASVVTNPDSLADSVPVPVPHRDPATGIIIDPDPDPDPIPVPDPVPDPDPDPDPEPDPDADEKVDPEQIAGLPDKITAAGDVTKLFPFCIPFDIIALVKSMKAEKAPPVWHFEFYFDQINYKFEVTVDMTQYEGYVKIFRSGFVILYIITLMLLTVRYSSGIVKD